VKIKLILASLSLLAVATSAVAQNPVPPVDPRPVTDTEPVKEPVQRDNYQDSTLAGGSGFVFPKNEIDYPDPCMTNPASCEDSGGSGTPPPPPPEPPTASITTGSMMGCCATSGFDAEYTLHLGATGSGSSSTNCSAGPTFNWLNGDDPSEYEILITTIAPQSGSVSPNTWYDMKNGKTLTWRATPAWDGGSASRMVSGQFQLRHKPSGTINKAHMDVELKTNAACF